ncbi:hypothetical protein CUMW_077660 [Citrus unshiu]|nr:hypothetical protein CUMW_077660 [Citrus unshiu]
MEVLPEAEKEEEKKKLAVTRRAFVQELKKVSFLAAPLAGVTVFQLLLAAVSTMMVGHLGKLSLASITIATSLTNVTGFTPLFGFACALETLCGQAYGAEQYQKIGTYTYSAMFFCIAICLPISVLWIFMDKILMLLHQNPQISVEARNYAIWLIPALFGYAILRSLCHNLQAQSLILTLFLSSCATLCLHILLCWVLVFKADFGNTGAALSISISYWFNVIILALYMRHSPSCTKTRTLISKEILPCMKEFTSFALPSVFMFCFTIQATHYFIPFGIGAAASIRVSNELGAGNPQPARLATRVAVALAVAEAAIVSIALFRSRHVLAYAFNSDQDVVKYVSRLAPLLSIAIFMDNMQSILSGVARGIGWQHIGAYINLGAFYLVGIPVAYVLCFAVHLRTKGLLLGLMSGSTVQAVALAVVTSLTNWQKQATMVRERTLEGAPSTENPSV